MSYVRVVPTIGIVEEGTEVTVEAAGSSRSSAVPVTARSGDLDLDLAPLIATQGERRALESAVASGQIAFSANQRLAQSSLMFLRGPTSEVALALRFKGPANPAIGRLSTPNGRSGTTGVSASASAGGGGGGLVRISAAGFLIQESPPEPQQNLPAHPRTASVLPRLPGAAVARSSEPSGVELTSVAPQQQL